jgi:hypothetical protein
MPLKLNIAMSRKVGEPNYGSRGATVGLELEVDSSLAEQPQQLQERIDRLFRLAQEAVDRELNGRDAAAAASANHEPPVRPATPAQIRAIHAIANRQNLDLTEELKSRFGVYRSDDLSLEEASALIDAIKPVVNGVAGH